MVEEKWNPAAADTSNVAIEEEILTDSKAFLFVIGWPIADSWYARVLTRFDLQGLLQSTKLTYKGRFHTFTRKPTGQTFPDGTRKVSALVPVKDLMSYGQGIDEYIAKQKEQLIF